MCSLTSACDGELEGPVQLPSASAAGPDRDRPPLGQGPEARTGRGEAEVREEALSDNGRAAGHFFRSSGCFVQDGAGVLFHVAVSVPQAPVTTDGAFGPRLPRFVEGLEVEVPDTIGSRPGSEFGEVAGRVFRAGHRFPLG